MAKSKKKPKNQSPGRFKRAVSALFGSGGSFFRRAVYLCLFVAATVGAVIGFGRMEDYVRKITLERQVQLKVVMKSQPTWAGDELIEQVCLSSGIRSDDFLLQGNLTSQWMQNLRKNAWVKNVRGVRKYYDGTVEIDCQLREPIAMLKHGDDVRYVDAEGVILSAMPVSRHLVQLRDKDSVTSLRQPGESVGSQSLMAGLAVLSLIREMDEHLPRGDRLWHELALLDVSNYEGHVDYAKAHLTLFTKNQTEIRWGAAIERELPYNEAPWKYKLASLYRAYKQEGTLDAYSYVDLREWRKEKSDPLRQG